MTIKDEQLKQDIKDSGGSAFPVNEVHHVNPSSGLSKREYFASKFAPSYLKCVTTLVINNDGSRHVYSAPAEEIAQMAYALADAMIAEGNK